MPTVSASNPVPSALYWLLAAIHVVCPLLFFTDLTRNPYFTQISLLQGGLCLGVVLFVLHALRRRETSIAFTTLDVPLLVFLGVALASVLFSWIVHPNLRTPIWNEGSRVTHFLVVNGLLAFWFAVQVRDPVWRDRFRVVLYTVGAIAGGYGILQYLGSEFVWSTTLNPYSGRPVSTFGNPNFLSSYLVLLLPLVMADGLRSRNGRRSLLMGGLFLLFLSAIICTMTRSSWIGGLVSLATLGWFARDQIFLRRRWLIVLAVCACLLVVFWPSSPLAERSMRPVDRVTELVRGVTKEKAYGSWHQRLMIWSCAWDMVKERPLLGKGWGCFELFYPFYQGWYLADDVFRTFRTHANNAHNILLEIWSQTGTVGMGIFFWICVLFFELARRRIPNLPEPDRIESWAYLAGLVGMVADNFFGNVSVFFAVPAFLFWWMAGTLAGRISPGPKQTFFTANGTAWAVGAGIILLSCAGISRAYAHWRAEVQYFEGFKKAKQGDVLGAIAATEKSHEHRRWEVNNNYELGNAYARQARWAAEQGLSREADKMLARALWAYDESIAANAGYDEIYFNRAAVLTQMNRLDDAVQSYRMALLINPLSLEAYKALGNVYLTRPEYFSKAADHFERAVFYFPKEKDLWNNLGYVYSRLKKRDDAVEAYANAVRADFKFPTAWQNFRIALKEAGKTEHPLLEIPDLWERTQRNIQARRWKEARSIAEKLVALLPESPEARLLVGGICFSMEDLSCAQTSYEKALDLAPNDREAKKGRARVYLKEGNRDAAANLLRPLVGENRGDQEAAQLLNQAVTP